MTNKVKNTKKTFTIRYYIPNIRGENGEEMKLYSYLSQIDKIPESIGYVRQAETGDHQVRISEVLNNEIRATFIKFSAEAPLIGQRIDKIEETLTIPTGKEVIHKNHFILFYDGPVELLAYQSSMEGLDIYKLATYVKGLIGDNCSVTFTDIVVADAFSTIGNGLLKSVEYEIAKPKSKSHLPFDKDTFTKEAFDFMTKTGATSFKVKILTRSRSKGLVSDVMDRVKLLLSADTTKKLRIKMSDIDEPIDLLTDRIKDKVKVDIPSDGVISSELIFTEISAAKRKNTALLPYLAIGDEALD